MSARLVFAVLVLTAAAPSVVQAGPLAPEPAALSAMLWPAGHPCAYDARHYCPGIHPGAPQMNCLNVNIYRVDKKCGAMLRMLRIQLEHRGA